MGYGYRFRFVDRSCLCEIYRLNAQGQSHGEPVLRTLAKSPEAARADAMKRTTNPAILDLLSVCLCGWGTPLDCEPARAER